MKLGQLKKHIESFEDGHWFNYSLSEPFSWRGVYSEVAFSIEECRSTKEDVLDKLSEALTEEFYGYKGGKYRFNEDMEVNFEKGISYWTDGGYIVKFAEDLGIEPRSDEYIIKQIFK